MSELVLEAGKTYVLKDDEYKEDYILSSPTNSYNIQRFYNEGFKIEGDYFNGGGYIEGRIIIGTLEKKYFKLKGENDMKEFTKDMLKDGMVVEFRGQQQSWSKGRHLLLYGKLINTTGYCNLEDFDEDIKYKGHNSQEFDIMKVYKVLNSETLNINRWELELIWERKELTEQQKKILELEEAINKAQEQIKQLKGE